MSEESQAKKQIPQTNTLNLSSAYWNSDMHFFYKMNLTHWFKDKNYEEGVKLFEDLCPSNTFLINLFKKSKTSFTVSELEKQLKIQLAKDSEPPKEKLKIEIPQAKPKRIKAVEPKAKADTKAVLKQHKSGFDEDKSEDEEVIKFVAHRKKLYVQRTQLKAKLNQMVWYAKKFTNQERGDLAKELTKTCNELAECWKDTLYYRKEGKLPDKSEEQRRKDVNTNELQKRLMTVRTYLTKIKKGKLSNKKEAIYEAEQEEILLKLKEAYEI